jgi:hypothetical protein
MNARNTARVLSHDGLLVSSFWFLVHRIRAILHYVRRFARSTPTRRSILV